LIAVSYYWGRYQLNENYSFIVTESGTSYSGTGESHTTVFPMSKIDFIVRLSLPNLLLIKTKRDY
jgi:hypothetical protein